MLQESGEGTQFVPPHRTWLFLPFMHSERLEDQQVPRLALVALGSGPRREGDVMLPCMPCLGIDHIACSCCFMMSGALAFLPFLGTCQAVHARSCFQYSFGVVSNCVVLRMCLAMITMLFTLGG